MIYTVSTQPTTPLNPDHAQHAAVCPVCSAETVVSDPFPAGGSMHTAGCSHFVSYTPVEGEPGFVVTFDDGVAE